VPGGRTGKPGCPLHATGGSGIRGDVLQPSASARARLLHGAGLVAQFLSLQGLTQLCTLATGLLIVRSLPVSEYALYTITLTFQGTLMVLADSGVSSVMSAIGGRVCEDRARFGQLVRTALRFRRTLEAITLAGMAPVLWVMLRKEGAEWHVALGAVLMIALVLHQLVYIGVLTVVPRLHLQFNRLQRIELTAAGVRLGLVALLSLWGGGFLAMLTASVVSLALQSRGVEKLAWGLVERATTPNAEDRAELLRAFKHQVLNGLYYAFQPQITLWLISVFGTTRGIAEVWALGRLSAVFSLVTAVLANIVVPRFARLDSVRLLRRRYLQTAGGVLALGLLLLSAALLFPEAILWVLGPKYAHLRYELALMVLLAGVNQLCNTLWLMNAARAWIWNVWINVPLTVGLQMALVPMMALSTSRAVLVFGILSLLPTFGVNVMLTVRGMREQARRERELALATPPADAGSGAPALASGTHS